MTKPTENTNGMTQTEVFAEVGRLHLMVEKMNAIVAEKDRVIAALSAQLKEVPKPTLVEKPA